MKFIVIGCGSIGRRHIKNLLLLGHEAVGVDISNDNRKWVEENLKIKTYADIQAAFSERPDGCLVCTPPNSHITIAQTAVDNGLHAFIEKPLSNSLDGVDKLIKTANKRKVKIAIGYNLRFHKGILKMKELIDGGKIGKILSARILFGQYLPDWRPTQDYRTGYTASKKMGGGIILDDSHELDYARWLLGGIKELNCVAAKVSNLEVETEDTAEIMLKFGSGAMANVHMDFVRRDYARACELIGEKGTARWDYTKGMIEIYEAESKQIETIDVKCDPNDMYVAEIRHFIECIKNGNEPLVDAEEGKKTLLLALKSKEAAEKGKTLKVDI